MILDAVHITEAVLVGLGASAIRAMPLETGGALIGWREGTCVSVMDYIEIPAARSEGSRYELTATALDRALVNYLSGTLDARLGYVGSWHTHPRALGPSMIDKHTFRKVARAHHSPLAFIVAATDGRSTTMFTTWVGALKGRYRLQPQESIMRRGD